MTIAIYYILFIAVVMISGWSIKWFNFVRKDFITILLAFSGAYLLGVTFFHMVPEVFNNGLKQPGVYVLLGYLIQIGLDYFSKGIEHGHAHVYSKSGQFPWVVFLSLCLHSFFEGMPVLEHHHDHDHRSHAINIPFVSGVMLHKIPVAIVLGSLFHSINLSKKKTLLFLFVFSLTFPLGSGFSILLEETLIHNVIDLHQIIAALVLGVLLHISTIILIESGNNHRYSFYKLASILIGFVLSYLSTV